MELRAPEASMVPSYVAALRAGWSPDTRRPERADDQIHAIETDPDAFLASLDDREGTRPPVTMPDGTQRRRVPGFTKWMWDGEFCGSINLRWDPGGRLPSHVPGHIGYSVVPWKRRRGYATAALAAILLDAAAVGLDHVEITTDADNVASRRVIEANGGVFVERFTYDPTQDTDIDGLRFRIVL